MEHIEGYDSKESYLKHRQEYIGGADAAGVLGLSTFPDTTRRTVWRHKVYPVSEIDPLENRHLDRGVYMEGVAQEKIQSGEWGDKLDPNAEPGEHHRHDEYEFIGGTPDLETDDEVYEVKAPSMEWVDEYRSEGLPRHYWAQGQHYHLLRKKPVVFVFIDYDKWDVYTIPLPEPDEGVQRRMIETYRTFWNEYVKTETPPSENDLPDMDMKAARGGERINRLLHRYYTANQTKKEADAERKEIKGRILTHARGLDAIETEDYRATISTRSRGDSSWKVLRVSPLRA